MEDIVIIEENGNNCQVTKVEKMDGDASIISARGKVRYVYDFGFELKFTFIYAASGSNNDEEDEVTNGEGDGNDADADRISTTRTNADKNSVCIRRSFRLSPRSRSQRTTEASRSMQQ